MDLVVRLAVVVAVEEKEREGEGKPDCDEAHLLLAAREPHVERVEAGQRANRATGEAQEHGVPFNLATDRSATL